jgi:S-adenosylmethionine synthetase
MSDPATDGSHVTTDTTFVVSAPAIVPPDSREVEIVERKGKGHPDSICDALAEAFSISLTRAYHARFGTILHHNVDKILLAAGSSAPRFGGGDVTTPLEIYLGGRATAVADGVEIPIAEIGEQASRAWLRANLHALDVDRHVRIHSVVRPGSSALTSLVREGQRHAVANDTSIGVGHAPASRLERVVLAIEQTLTSAELIAAHPVIGEDVKVMGLRRGRRIDITIACAMVDRYVRGLSDYTDATALAADTARQVGAGLHDGEMHVTVNHADDLAAGEAYLTVSGTSAEAGDDGEVGRGNRVGGLITPCRPMTIEAAAGKNAVAHVGKSYNIVAHTIAAEIVATCPDVSDVTCLLVSRIGSLAAAPQVVELQVRMRGDTPLETVAPRAEAIARARLGDLGELPQRLLARAAVESPALWPGITLF